MGALSVPRLEENSERNTLLDAKLAPELLDLRVKEEQVRSVPAKKILVLSDPRRLPAVDDGLGDYTQWVHLACPHCTKISLDRPSRLK